MDKRIIFPSDDGGVCVMTPILHNCLNDAGEWLPLREGQEAPEGYRMATIEDIVAKDVPAGKPWKIIDVADLPDRSTRQAWEYVE